MLLYTTIDTTVFSLRFTLHHEKTFDIVDTLPHTNFVQYKVSIAGLLLIVWLYWIWK